MHSPAKWYFNKLFPVLRRRVSASTSLAINVNLPLVASPPTSHDSVSSTDVGDMKAMCSVDEALERTVQLIARTSLCSANAKGCDMTCNVPTGNNC